MPRNGHSGRCFRDRRHTAARLAKQGRNYQAELSQRRAEDHAQIVKQIILSTQHLAGKMRDKIRHRMLTGTNRVRGRRAARGT